MRSKAKNKVAIVYHYFAHYRGAVIEELARSDRYNYTFIADSTDPLNEGIKPFNFPEHISFVRTRCRYIRREFLIQQGLLKSIIVGRYDTIIFLADARFISTWLAAIVARCLGKQVIFWTIGWLRHEGGLKDIVRRTFYHLSNSMLLYGNFAKTLGIEKGFAAEKLYVVYNSLDYEQQKRIRNGMSFEIMVRLREKLFSEPHLPLVICTSRLTPKRRLSQLLEAMSILYKQNHKVNLLLVGDGPERAALESFARDNSLSVNFYGECYDEETLCHLVMSANVTAAPGMVGLTAMHSLAYGTPVISHDNPDKQAPEYEAVIPGVNGDLFRENDCESLAAYIKKWTATEYPQEAIREKCHEVVERLFNPVYQKVVIERAIAGDPAV